MTPQRDESKPSEMLDYIDEMLGGHFNLYKLHFGEDSDPEIDVCRKGLKKVREYLARPEPRLGVEENGGKFLFEALAQRLIRRILDAADMSLPDATDIELSLARIIGERDNLKSQTFSAPRLVELDEEKLADEIAEYDDTDCTCTPELMCYRCRRITKQAKAIVTKFGHSPLTVSEEEEHKWISDCCKAEIYTKPNSWKLYCCQCNESCENIAPPSSTKLNASHASLPAVELNQEAVRATLIEAGCKPHIAGALSSIICVKFSIPALPTLEEIIEVIHSVEEKTKGHYDTTDLAQSILDFLRRER